MKFNFPSSLSKNRLILPHIARASMSPWQPISPFDFIKLSYVHESNGVWHLHRPVSHHSTLQGSRSAQYLSRQESAFLPVYTPITSLYWLFPLQLCALFNTTIRNAPYSDHFAWRQAAQLPPQFQYAVSRGPCGYVLMYWSETASRQQWTSAKV